MRPSPRDTQPSECSAATLVQWYRQMCRIRAFERAVLALNKSGLIHGTAHLYIGMEAIAVGACAVMDDSDLLTSTHRGHGHCIARGLDLNRMMAEILGRVDGYCRGKGGSMHIADFSLGMLGADGIVGGGIPIAVGAALGEKLKGCQSVVFCFFGDGAVNQGSFHEAVNLAAARRLPIVLICENNLWALSAPFAEATAGGSVAGRAAAYGIPGMEVDGNDVQAVFEATHQAARHARGGCGPSLIECRSYRWEAHSIFTRTETRPAMEIERWKHKDPIARLRERLLALGTAFAAQLDAIDSDVSDQVARAADFAKNSPKPAPESAFQDIDT
jgi:TPP-dependent pyruvate/acetoin dehydrogenase alpha subunit